MPHMSTNPNLGAPRAEHEVFARIMRSHNQRLFRTARAILRDDAEAEDALQEAYLQAYRALPGFRGDAALSTWLVRIVANEALGRLRKRARRAQVIPFGAEAGQNPEDAVMDESNDAQPERTAARAQARRLIETRIDALPDSFRAVFVLRALEELTVEETAAALGIPAPTVRTRYFRARALLREALATELDLGMQDAFGFAGARCDRIVARVLARLATELP
jgi:RNA polymerase sigma-70 factor (ECF subfamily)